MEERIYTVYMHTNLENNKKYVGLTSQKPRVRWGYGYGYEKCPYFFNAIKKNGWNGFSHEIVLQNLTKDEAEMFEIAMIKYYNTTDKEFGYNIDNGGNSSGKRTQETKDKISKSNTGKKLSKETRDKISKNRKGKCVGTQHHLFGKPGTFTGRHHTEESKKKISENNKGKIISLELREIIRKTNTGNKYCLGRKASEETKKLISKNRKGKCCGKDNPSFGKQITEEFRQHLIKINSKKIICIETKEVFKSTKEASKITKINESTIGRCCRKEFHIAGGFHWAFYDEYLKNPDDSIYLTSRKKTGKTVYCEETKEYYPSLKHVSDLFKIDLSYLGKCMRKGKICKGYHFKYIDKQ